MSDQPVLADNANLARADGLVASEVNGEIVILSIEVGHFFHLNTTASRIWDLLDTPTTVTGLCAAMRERFAVDPEECCRDVHDFVEGMLAKGLLERV